MTIDCRIVNRLIAIRLDRLIGYLYENTQIYVYYFFLIHYHHYHKKARL